MGHPLPSPSPLPNGWLAAMAQFKVPVGVSQHLGLRGQRLEMLGQRDLPTVLTSS